MSPLRQKLMELLEKHIKEGSKNLPQGVRVERKDWSNFATAGTIRPELLKALMPEEAEKLEKSIYEGYQKAREIVKRVALGADKAGAALTPAVLAKSIHDNEDGNADTIVKSLIEEGYKPTAGAVAIIANLLEKSKIVKEDKDAMQDAAEAEATLCKQEGCKNVAKAGGACGDHEGK